MRIEASRIAQAIGNDLASAREEEQDHVRNVRALEQKSLAQSRDELRLLELDREAQASRLLHETFLTRLNETSAQETLQGASARLLTAAEAPGMPDTLSRKVILAAGVLGLAVGLGLVRLMEVLTNTFRSVGELKSQTGFPVLAALPEVGRRMHRTKLLEHLRRRPSSALPEAIRNLRTSILFSNVDRPPKVVMFTSTVPREGKSTTAVLFAQTSEQMGRSGIVVECDLRLPTLGQLFGKQENGPGLLAVLEGTADLDAAICRDQETGLHLLMVQPGDQAIQLNAADILMSRRFGALIDTLRHRYELVVLDTPPTLLVTDARVVTSLVDAVIYVVRWDHTPRGAVKEGLRELTSVNAPIAGMVMTMVREEQAGPYAYGHYRGQYKDYYSS